MNLLFLSVTSTILCIVIAFTLKYLSLLRWISGHAYVLSKRRENFSILEVLDLFKNVRPFPISCQKGWKIDSFAHGHRIWFNFLTFPHNLNAPSIKVYAVFDVVKSSSQSLLQVLKDITQSCEWKPGVISTSNTNSLTTHEKPITPRGLPSMPVQIDCVKEERLSHAESKFGLQNYDPWFTENVVPTISVEFKRFWHRENNGVCWLLQMNEALQTCEFYLVQPVEEVDHCLLSVVTWSRKSSKSSVDKASILLSSLEEYIALRKLQKTPLTTITLPQDLSESDVESSDSSQGNESISPHPPILRKMKHFILDRCSSNSSSSGVSNKKTELEKYSTILRYRWKNGRTSQAGSVNIDGAASSRGSDATSVSGSECFPSNAGDCSDQRQKTALQRSISDGVALKRSRQMNQELEDHSADTDIRQHDEGNISDHQLSESGDPISAEDLEIVHYKTTSNQCAAEVMAECLRASNIDLERTSEEQAASSGGWLFSSFEKNIVVLKKLHRSGSSVQSYIGKGFVLAPPKTVWDAVKNPRTRFTYDDTLKKVDIIETLNSTLKIVYFYHESQQFLNKESCDMCVLLGERQEGENYILTYSSIEHDKCPVNPKVTRAKFLPSGWIIEPAKQDNKVYSIVTYLMQIDFGRPREGYDNLPFQDMISRYPLSIADLQQYLKPAVQMLRRKSLT